MSRLINTRKLIGREKKEKRYEGKRIISREERGVTRSFISFASSINSPQEANALNVTRRRENDDSLMISFAP